jgi:dihydrofolate reductase
MNIVLIAAVAENGVIGHGNAIPWRLKSDQARFKAMTMGKPVVMGRKTFLSLRKPLPGRTNIVLAPIDPRDWEEAARTRHSATPDDSADFSYVTYRRRKQH